MSDKGLELTRRKILASMGAVGAAGAGVGAGTSALFSDTESFDGNTLAAGELDLKVDWEEHYYNGGAPPENGEGIESLRQVDGADDIAEGEVGLPDPHDPVIAVAAEDLDAFMSASTTESGGPTDDPPGVVQLGDVKPGDFGEITLSYHLYSNPGYVRLEAEERADNESGQPEPEREVDDSTGSGAGELGEKAQAVVWYDPDCDNVFDRSTEAVLAEGSLAEVVNDELPAVLDPTESGGRVAEGYEGNCHGTIATPGGPPFECSEQLYLTKTVDDPEQDPSGNEPFGSPADDTTKLYRADIDGGEAELTELFDFNADITSGPDGGSDFDDDGVGDYNHVVSIAASPDGGTVYAIDKFSARLGEYDVENGDFTDRGVIQGAPDTSLQAAVAPDGALYFTVFGQSDLYVIEDPSSSKAVDTVISLTDQNGDPIVVGGSDIAFLSNGTLYLFDGNVDDGTPDLYRLPDPSTGDATLVSQLSDANLPGLAVRAAGDGNLIGNDSEGNRLYEIDPKTGSEEATYPMKLGGDDFDQQFGDMTVGALCPEHCVGFAWWVPRDVGNEIQSDTYEFDITFRTEQCRNNPEPFDGS